MKLSQGRFYGKTLYRCDVDGLTLTDCVYTPSQRVAEHCHASSYLSVLLQGAYHEKIGTSEIACTSGTALFHPVEESHRDNFGNTGGRLFSVELDRHWLDRLHEERVATKEGFAIRGQVSGLAFRLASLVREVNFNQLCAQGLVLEMLGQLPRSRCITKEVSEPRWLKSIEEALRASSSESIVLRRVCENHGIHPSHVGRTFRRFRGCSMSTYIRRLRLEQARDHLLQSERSLTEIATLLGFADHSHFSRVFKGEMGVSPREFRRLQQSECSRMQRTF